MASPKLSWLSKEKLGVRKCDGILSFNPSPKDSSSSPLIQSNEALWKNRASWPLGIQTKTWKDPGMIIGRKFEHGIHVAHNFHCVFQCRMSSTFKIVCRYV